MNELAFQVASALLERKLNLVTAESCTGGLITSYLTSLPGSSNWLEGGFVTYRLSAKVDMLGVKQKTLDDFTAVSEPVAREMATGALANSRGDISVAVTGVAGPGGGDIIAPVGTVWFGWALREPGTSAIECVQTSTHEFDGDREEIRHQAVEIALRGILAAI